MKVFPILFLIIGLIAPVSSASATTDELDELKTQLLQLLKRVESLEAENRSLRSTVSDNSEQIAAAGTSPAAEKKKQWADSIKISGDLRARHESFDIEGRDDRERSRVRARVAITAKPFDNTEVGIGLASGGDDPVSTNQTLGGGASTKDARLDLAYFKWQARPGVTVIGGKMKNPFFKAGGNGLIWDGDLRPEGLSLSYKGESIFVNSGLHFLESDTKKDNSRLGYGLQAGYAGEIGNSQITTGASYFKIGAEGRSAWYDDDFFGNSSVCAAGYCTYASDYDELEIFFQLATKIGDQPLTLFADYVQNQDASDLDTAWAAGFKLGKASNPGTWELAWVYQDIEADSVFALWNDSDFGGGVTDTKGHILKGAWAFHKKWKVAFTYFDNEQHVDLGNGDDYQRLQLDWQYKF